MTPLFGLDIVSLTSTPVLMAALLGAGAALGGQVITQIGTGYFKASERRIKENRVRRVFRVRVRAVGTHIASFSKMLEGDVSHLRMERIMRYAQKLFDPLASDVANTELLLSLAPDAIEMIGSVATRELTCSPNSKNSPNSAGRRRRQKGGG
jgi:hypothetical protein